MDLILQESSHTVQQSGLFRGLSSPSHFSVQERSIRSAQHQQIIGEDPEDDSAFYALRAAIAAA